ncbi:MAG: OmpP1/FadL family transporter, partial [Chloroflexota bacterium]
HSSEEGAPSMPGLPAAKVAVFTIIFAITTSAAFGGGYSIPLQTTEAIGQAGALTAGVDDASAVFYNPAALTEVKENQVTADAIYINTISRITNGGVSAKNKHDDSFLPTLFANYRLPGKNLTLGMGIYSPFGFATTYDERGITRFASIRSELRTMYVTPSVAWQPTSWFSLGGGVSYVHSSAVLTRSIFLGGPEGHLRLTGTDDSYAYNFGFIVKPIDSVKIGFTYRSKVDLNFDGGDVKFGIGPVTSTKAHGTHVPLPQLISLGANWEINPKWAVELVYDHTHWSQFDHLKASFDTPLLGGLITGFFIPQKWKDTSTIRFGTRYKLNESIELRAGIILDESPTPNKTLSPAIPGADLLTLNGGVSYRWRNLKTSLSYMPVFYKTRRVLNNVLETGGDASAIPAPGLSGKDKYETFQHFVAFQLQYNF